MKIKDIPLKLCVPMPEVDREYYNPRDYAGLKRLIKKDGFNRKHFICVIFDKKKKVYEVFDGIHRTKIMKELGKSTIPAVIETGKTRSKIIAEGIKSNQFRAANNPIDLAKSLKALGEIISKEQDSKSKTRPFTLHVRELAEEMSMAPSKVSELLKLMKLPKHVIHLLGEGKLRFNHGKALCSLLETEYEHEIEKLAELVIKEDIGYRGLMTKIYALKGGKLLAEIKLACDGCGKTFPRTHLSVGSYCPDCISNNGNSHKRKYEKFYDFVESHYTRQEKMIPKCAEEHLEKLRLESLRD